MEIILNWRPMNHASRASTQGLYEEKRELESRLEELRDPRSTLDAVRSEDTVGNDVWGLLSFSRLSRFSPADDPAS